MTGILDDVDSRPGSATSLLRTVVGLYLRDLGGWIATRDLVALMDGLGIVEPQTRTALSRVKAKGLLHPEQRGATTGYRLNSSATKMLERGDRRLFHPRAMQPEDSWCVILAPVPEAERPRRQQLRRRLHWIGCGSIGKGLWICPDFLRDEVEEVLVGLNLQATSTLFVSERPIVPGDLSDAVASWWDLPGIAKLHGRFVDECTGLDTRELVGAGDAFSRYVTAIDTWRIIPYRDPGLPHDLLPDDWPGKNSSALFDRIRQAHEIPSKEYVHSVLHI